MKTTVLRIMLLALGISLASEGVVRECSFNCVNGVTISDR